MAEDFRVKVEFTDTRGGGGVSQTGDRPSFMRDMLGGKGGKAAGAAGKAAGGLGGMMGGLGKALGPIGLALAVLVPIVQGISDVFKPVMTVLNAIGKVIGQLVRPVMDFLLALLLPILQILRPFMQVIRTMIAPFRKALFELSRLMTLQMKTGDTAGAMSTFMKLVVVAAMPVITVLLKLVGESVKLLLTAIELILKGLFRIVMEAIMLITKGLDKIIEFFGGDPITPKLEEWTDKGEGKIGEFFQGARDGVDSAIDFVNQKMIEQAQRFGDEAKAAGDLIVEEINRAKEAARAEEIMGGVLDQIAGRTGDKGFADELAKAAETMTPKEMLEAGYVEEAMALTRDKIVKEMEDTGKVVVTNTKNSLGKQGEVPTEIKKGFMEMEDGAKRYRNAMTNYGIDLKNAAITIEQAWARIREAESRASRRSRR